MYELMAAAEGWPETDWLKPWRPKVDWDSAGSNVNEDSGVVPGPAKSEGLEGSARKTRFFGGDEDTAVWPRRLLNGR